MSTSEQQLQDLALPFAENDIEWRVGSCGEGGRDGIWCRVLPFLTNRAIQERLDQVMGPQNWSNHYEVTPCGILCRLSLKIDGEWISKTDGAEQTDIEAFKGGLSNAMKRAAVQWGIGRFLYQVNDCWATISENGFFRGKTKSGKEFNWDPPRLNLGKYQPVPDQTKAAPAAAKSQPVVTTKTDPNAAPPPPEKKECEDLYWALVDEKRGILSQELKPLVHVLYKSSPTWPDRLANMWALRKAIGSIAETVHPKTASEAVLNLTMELPLDRKNPTPEQAGDWLTSLCHLAETGALPRRGVEI